MSNIKKVEITGTIPFDFHENDFLAHAAAFIFSPTSGLKWEWHNRFYKANEHGGKTCMYGFRIIGEEAFSWGWFENFEMNLRRVKGTITKWSVVDPEDA